MALIDWSERYSVGIKICDDQHKKLFALLNDLHDSMKNGKGRDVMGKILNELISYTVTHFKTEEDFFARHAYPETPSHKASHAALTQKAVDLKKRFEEGGVLTLEVMNFLRDWLNSHIAGEDKKYTAYLNSKGVQ